MSIYRLARAYFNEHLNNGEMKARVSLPYNDVAPEEYCFYNVISESADVDALEAHAKRLGFTLDDIEYDEITSERHPNIHIEAVVPISETTGRFSRKQRQALVWVKIPNNRWFNLDIRETIGAMTEADAEGVHENGVWSELGVSNYGGDIDGNAAVIIEGWHFYHFAPLYGYTWQSVLNCLGVKGDEPEPFGFEDDSFMCLNCGVIDRRDGGYNYNERKTPSGDYLGVNCGCYDEACEEEFAENINQADKCINRDVADKLAEDGKLEFVCDETHRSFTAHTITPEDVLKQLLTENPDDKYIMALDNCGQFHTNFSVWKVTE